MTCRTRDGALALGSRSFPVKPWRSRPGQGGKLLGETHTGFTLFTAREPAMIPPKPFDGRESKVHVHDASPNTSVIVYTNLLTSSQFAHRWLG